MHQGQFDKTSMAYCLVLHMKRAKYSKHFSKNRALFLSCAQVMTSAYVQSSRDDGECYLLARFVYANVCTMYRAVANSTQVPGTNAG